MLTIDSATLSALVKSCFLLSMDGRLTPQQQGEFLVAGKRLRGLLLNLISAQFNPSTAAVVAANAQLGAVNQQIGQLGANLANVKAVITQATAVISTLDGLLSLAAKFV